MISSVGISIGGMSSGDISIVWMSRCVMYSGGLASGANSSKVMSS